MNMPRVKNRVLGIGHAKIDHLAAVDRYPDPDTMTELAGFSIQSGGVIATALATLSRLGVEASFIGKLSNDDFGRFIMEDFDNLSIDTTGVIRQAGRVSPYAFTSVEPEAGRRNVFFTHGNVDRLNSAEVQLERLDGAELLLIDGFHPDAQILLAEEAGRRGIKVVLDAGTQHEGMGELVALCDILLASERYASEVAPRGEIEDSLIELSRMGPQIVVVTMGKEGSIGLEGDKLVHQPPLQVKVVDTTGAGDVYFGGYCFGLLNQWPLERCMQIASTTAGLSCQELGARAALPDLEEVEAVSWQEVRT